MERLRGKTVLVTGGSSGLGLAAARRMIAEGARVMITGTDEERLGAAVAQLGARAEGVQVDVRSLPDLERLAGQVRDSFAALDVLFVNAGLGAFAPLEAVDEQMFDRQFDVNVKGAFFTVQKLAGVLADGASVIFNASAVHEKGLAAGSVYFATKAAVRSFVRTLAVELAPRRIRVNSVSPGLVLTPFQQKMGMGEEALAGFVGYVRQVAPLGRTGEPEEIAAAVAFLASADASYVTAEDLAVDGGFMQV
jgi:NAD(P)-dependent dehydrogenase (short-subunit alcohol dehydrogenase family)